MLIVHIIIVVNESHGALAAVAPAFQKLKIGQSVAVSAPASPVIHRNSQRLAAVKAVIWMQMILLVFEVAVCPVKAKIVQGLFLLSSMRILVTKPPPPFLRACFWRI